MLRSKRPFPCRSCVVEHRHSAGDDGKARSVGIGLIGYGSIGRAHVYGFKTMPYIMWPPPALPRLAAIAGRNEDAVREAQIRYGFERFTTDWHELVADPGIQVLDNAAPNHLHAEPCIAAARRGKHLLCEKPLGRSAEEAKGMLAAAEDAGVVHMVGFNYRFVPALRLAYDLIQAGRIGDLYHFRGVYLRGRIARPDAPMTWRLRRETAGSGAIGDLGSHTIDLARWLVGEIASVRAVSRTFIARRPAGSGSASLDAVTVDDGTVTAVEFERGAIGTIEATRFATGRRNHQAIEINGARGSIAWDLERLNELEVYCTDDLSDIAGFHDVLVTEGRHPYYRFWWPPGHTIAWSDTFVHEVYHFLTAVTGGGTVAPHGATFADGYRNAVIVDAIQESAETGRCVYPIFEVESPR